MHKAFLGIKNVVCSNERPCSFYPMEGNSNVVKVHLWFLTSLFLKPLGKFQPNFAQYIKDCLVVIVCLMSRSNKEDGLYIYYDMTI